MTEEPTADPRIARARADVQKNGWHVVKVLADESGPAFAYSIGMFETFGHSEILMFGFEPDLMHRIINNVGFDIRSGKRFSADQRDDDVLNNYEVESQSGAASVLCGIGGDGVGLLSRTSLHGASVRAARQGTSFSVEPGVRSVAQGESADIF